jgi:hypothetical protein
MKSLLVAAIFTFSMCMQAQDTENVSFLKTDSTWTKEHFVLPTGFAQDMTINGMEEAVFPPGWGKPEDTEFWSYIFVWAVEAAAPLSEAIIENNLERYFDGLLDVRSKDTTVTKLPSSALLLSTEKDSKKEFFIGKVRIFDRFRTRQMITLNLLCEQYFCNSKQRAVIVFRFSPAEFDTAVWKKMIAIPMRKNICDLK